MNTGIINIGSAPEGVEIYMDGNPIKDTSGNVAKTPLMLTYVPAGPHLFTFKLPGYFDEIKLISSIVNMQHNIYVVMRQIPR